MAQTTPLRRRMLDDMTVRNLSPATQQSYVYAVAKFSRFCANVASRYMSSTRRASPSPAFGTRITYSNKPGCSLRASSAMTQT